MNERHLMVDTSFFNNVILGRSARTANEPWNNNKKTNEKLDEYYMVRWMGGEIETYRRTE